MYTYSDMAAMAATEVCVYYRAARIVKRKMAGGCV